MMSILWVCMLIVSVFSSLFQVSPENLTSAALTGAKDAISLCISLGGPLCLWSGMAKVMERSGLIEKVGRALRPILKKLFPLSCKDPLTPGYLTSNISANLLGLGNAATPMGVAAAKEMAKRRGDKTADDEMCRFIVLNTASLQLLPTTVATIRSTAGSSSPFDILPGVWITSIVSVTVGLIACSILRRFYG